MASTSCGTVMPLAMFWGRNEHAHDELLLIVPCACNLLNLSIRTALFVCAEKPELPFSIPEVFAYHQREVMETRKRSPDQLTSTVERAAAARAAADRVIRSRPSAEVRAQAATVASAIGAIEVDVLSTLPTPDAKRRRRVQKALKLFDAISYAAWLTCFLLRQPWGLATCMVIATLSLYGVACLPIAEDPAQRTTTRTVAHYTFATIAFACVATALFLSHGYCGWPALPFVLCVLVAAAGALTSYTEPYKRWPKVLTRGIRWVWTLCQWSAVIIFYLAVLLPPAYDFHERGT